MVCPYCHGVWDANKNACTSCGLAIRTSRQAPPVESSLFTSLKKDYRREALKVKLYAESEPCVRALRPGALLLNGRYRLYACQGKQAWLSDAYEATWLAQDAQRGGALVRMSEFVLPDRDAIVKQSIVRAATMAFHTISRHAHVPTLLDVFSDQERSFFVFEHVEGESLLDRMQRTGRFLPEREVIECCLQMTKVLEFLAQQSPPLVHGLLRPENILVERTGSHYMLLNFSIMLAGGATQFIMGVPRQHLSAYTVPEFARGTIDVRSDIYALIATAYTLVTGSPPTRSNASVAAIRGLNQMISPQFEAILAKGLNSGKGLRPDITQRYQHSSELHQDLLVMHRANGTLAPASIQRPQQVEHKDEIEPQLRSTSNNSVVNHPILQNLVSNIDVEEPVLLLPRPEELPPLLESHDAQQAMMYFVSLLVCLVLIVIVGRGLM